MAVAANASSVAEFLGLTRDDRAALILPFHYSYGLSVLNSHLAAGGSIHFARSGAGDPAFAGEMREARCTNIAGVPYSYELMNMTGFRRAELPALALHDCRRRTHRARPCGDFQAAPFG